EVYISTGIYWPVVTEDPNNPQLRMFGPLGGDSGFPSGRIFEYPNPPKYRVTPAVVKDGQFRTVYRNSADCPVPDYFVLDVSVWESDSSNNLVNYWQMIANAAAVVGGGHPATLLGEILSTFIAMLSSGDDALGRAVNEEVTIGPKEEIDKLCSCESDDRIKKYVEVPLENLATQLWKDCSAEDEEGFNFEDYNIEPPEHIGALGLKITLDKIGKSSDEKADAISSTQLSCVDLGQPDESIIAAVLALGAPLLSGSVSREYSMFLDVDNNLATGAQGYPYDGAEFELVAQFHNSDSPTYRLMQYSSGTGTFEEVLGGLYDSGVNIDSRAIFLQVELSRLGDPVGPIAGWGVVHEQGVVANVLPEHPAELALGLTPSYTYTGLPPIVVTTDPPHDAIDINRETPIHVVFSKSMARPEAEAAFSISPPVGGSFAWQGNTLFFTPSGLLAPMTRYEVTIGATATDRVGTLFDGNDDLTGGDSFTWEFITAGRPLSCCDVGGVEWGVFCEGEPIYVTGAEFDAFSEVEIYIVRHARAESISGAELIDVTDTGSNRASIDAEGVLPATLVGSITEEGEYNIIVDVNSNGLFDPGVDRCDKTGIGFAVLPGPRLVADLNDDGVVDYSDMEILTEEWLDGSDVQSDLNEDSKVDFTDYATLANAWLEDRTWPCEGCVREIGNVEFHQINWYDPHGVLVQENSLWGRMSFSYYPGDTTSYLNLTLANSLGGAEAWVVQNLPLFAVDNGDYSRRGEAVDINLAELGMLQGQDWPAVYWKLSVDRSIRTEALTEPNIFGAVEDLDRFACDSMDETPDPGPFTDAGTPKGIKLDKAPAKESKSRDVRGVQEDDAKWCAGSFARSIDWLNREHKLGIGRSAQQIYRDLIAAGVSKPNDDGSTARDEWIALKNTYARQKTGNKIVTKVWDPGGMVDPVTGVTEVNGDFVTWLKNELKHGEDVELAYYYPGNAHIVTVLEVYTEDGDTYVKYRDDEHQGDNSKGDKKVKHKKIYKKSGKYHFGADSNTIYFAVSQSPDKDQNGIGDGFESGMPR
ncbi:MAG: Ig-like domain-containing protein, partial [Phycisphaerales bacterium]